MPNKEQPVLAAVCGLYCGGCAVYIATENNDVEKLQHFAEMFGTDVEDVKCEGCRSGRVTGFCRNCEMVKCAKSKGVNSCGECTEVPCELFATFQVSKPHRKDIYKDFARIAEVGAHEWVLEMRKRYSCPSCGYPNSAYDLKCRRCGHEPSNAYVAEHMDEIKKYLALKND